MTEQQRLGQRIRWYREGRRLTQQDLATALAVTQQLIALYEGGHVDVTVSRLRACATVFGCRINDLIAEEEPAHAR